MDCSFTLHTLTGTSREKRKQQRRKNLIGGLSNESLLKLQLLYIYIYIVEANDSLAECHFRCM